MLSLLLICYYIAMQETSYDISYGETSAVFRKEHKDVLA